jgi:TPP-dependent trihydroxycyclohexane-1,2-dione (THcHDO) dehydratase
MNDENRNATTEALVKNAIAFLHSAMLNGDQQAVEILQALQELDEEFERTRAKVVDINSRPRRTQEEFGTFYQVAIPALDRLIEIQKEQQCIAMQITGSNFKVLANLLKQTKRKKIKQNFKDN